MFVLFFSSMLYSYDLSGYMTIKFMFEHRKTLAISIDGILAT